jgi:hypothetical protein
MGISADSPWLDAGAILSYASAGFAPSAAIQG